MYREPRVPPCRGIYSRRPLACPPYNYVILSVCLLTLACRLPTISHSQSFPVIHNRQTRILSQHGLCQLSKSPVLSSTSRLSEPTPSPCQLPTHTIRSNVSLRTDLTSVDINLCHQHLLLAPVPSFSVACRFAMIKFESRQTLSPAGDFYSCPLRTQDKVYTNGNGEAPNGSKIS